MPEHYQKPALAPRYEQKLRALCALSGVAEPVDFSHLVSMVRIAPDPETAVRGVLDRVTLPSEVLARKWRGVITDLWSNEHPNVPLVPELMLSAADVSSAPALVDTLAFLAFLEKTPIRLVRHNDEWLLDPEQVVQLAHTLPSLKESAVYNIESEWAVMPIRRLRAVLIATRLVRPVKGELVVVRSRLKRFRALPPTQQFFILWHADLFHVDWTEFAGLWGSYMRVIQEFLPLLWETCGEPEADQVVDRSHWAMHVIDAFQPFWEDEGLLDAPRGAAHALRIVQQHALPTIIDRFLIRDLFARHGLVELSEEFGRISKFTWTAIGSSLIPAEADQTLPCGNELLE